MSVSEYDPRLPPPPPVAPVAPTVSALDRSMAQLHDVPPVIWWRAAWQTVAGTVVVLLITEGGAALWDHAAGHPLNHIVAGLIGMSGEAGLLGVALYAARGLRARAGSWQAALGLARPRRRDLAWGLLWLVVQAIAAVVLRQVFAAVTSAATLHAANNVRNVHYHGPVRLALTLITGMLIAPIAEETQCRGVLLRAGMSRWTFSRAALMSSLVFGALHANQAANAAGAVLLVSQVAMFGFLQCLLVRKTGRLGPGMVTHGLNNGLATWAAMTG